MESLTITRPDDWHIHLRDGAALERTVNDVARWAHRAVVMPNLVPPIKAVADAESYRERILTVLHENTGDFEPLMTLYLTNETSPDEIESAAKSPHVHAVKLYPAGATTNSAAGVNNLEALYPTLAAMEKFDVPLLVHGEVTEPEIDIFDREKQFIDLHLAPLVQHFPRLRVVFEHITSRCRRFCHGRPRESCGNHHTATPTVQPQRHAGGWHSTPLFLPAHLKT